jgi:hypothetical protein
MILGEAHGINALLTARQAYAAQEHRFERVGPVAPPAREQGETGQAPGKRREFGFSLGKFGVRLEVEQSGPDPEMLARAALDHYNRERESAFRTEMEIAQLREALAASQGEEPVSPVSEGEPPALPSAESSASSYHALHLARRAYAEQDKAFSFYPHLPGVRIGVV